MMEKTIRELLVQMGEDPDREGLLDTPKRVAKMWNEVVLNDEDPPSMTTFARDRDGVDCDQIVLLTDIKFSSFCEHHMLPFMGVAHVGYLPKKKVVGLSKIPRAVLHFASRLQVQERLTAQVADFLFRELEPHGVCVMMKAEHMCMKIRGVKDPCSFTTTHAIRGTIDKSEFMQLVSMSRSSG